MAQRNGENERRLKPRSELYPQDTITLGPRCRTQVILDGNFVVVAGRDCTPKVSDVLEYVRQLPEAGDVAGEATAINLYNKAFGHDDDGTIHLEDRPPDQPRPKARIGVHTGPWDGSP